MLRLLLCGQMLWISAKNWIKINYTRDDQWQLQEASTSLLKWRTALSLTFSDQRVRMEWTTARETTDLRTTPKTIIYCLVQILSIFTNQRRHFLLLQIRKLRSPRIILKERGTAQGGQMATLRSRIHFQWQKSSRAYKRSLSKTRLQKLGITTRRQIIKSGLRFRSRRPLMWITAVW